MARNINTNSRRITGAAPSGDAWTMLAFARDRTEAELYAAVLSEFGIPTQLHGLEPNHTAALLADVAFEVLVPSSCEMRAGEIVAAHLSEHGLHPACGAGEDDDIEFDDDEDDFDDDEEEDDDLEDDDFDDFDDEDLDDDEDDEDDFDIDDDEL